ncbi:MAG: hypothetical protein PF692_01805 [Kiritimatiellae bacterium]|jgi:hypothetical protein|nr:hypothetical protein [Kiritimatiellia bacterium]
MSEDYKVDVEQYIKDQKQSLIIIYISMALVFLFLAIVYLCEASSLYFDSMAMFSSPQCSDFAVFFGFLGVFSVLLAILSYVSSVLVRKDRYASLCIITSRLTCLFFPVGTVLGCFALNLLRRISRIKAGKTISKEKSPAVILKRLSNACFIFALLELISIVVAVLITYNKFFTLISYDLVSVTMHFYSPALSIMTFMLLIHLLIFMGSIWIGISIRKHQLYKLSLIFSVLIFVFAYPLGAILGVLIFVFLKIADIKNVFVENELPDKVLKRINNLFYIILSLCLLIVVSVLVKPAVKQIFLEKPVIEVPSRYAYLSRFSDSDIITRLNVKNGKSYRSEIYRRENKGIIAASSCNTSTNKVREDFITYTFRGAKGKYLGKEKFNNQMCFKFIDYDGSPVLLTYFDCESKSLVAQFTGDKIKDVGWIRNEDAYLYYPVELTEKQWNTVGTDTNSWFKTYPEILEQWDNKQH